MEQFTQAPLPGMPIRAVLTGTWSSPEAPCTLRATLDVPSDQFASQIVGSDTEGLMVIEEFLQVFEDMGAQLAAQLERLVNGS